MTIFNESTYEEVMHLRLSPLHVLTALSTLAVVLIILTIMLIAFTNLREFIPGYPSQQLRRQITQNALRVDSLLNEVQKKDRFLHSIQTILRDENLDTTSFVSMQHNVKVTYDTSMLGMSEEEAGFREIVEKEEKYKADLLMAAKKAEAANRAKTEFLQRMSHDIRTPINGIMGMVDIIRKNRDDREKVDDSLDKIQLSTRHLLELVSDVLDMSKLEAGMFEIHEDAFDISELMDEVAALVDAQLVESGITHCKHRSNIKHTALKGSSLQLRRIMVNLLSNAIKYNKSNGTIDTYAEELSCDGTTVWYEFKIVDTGIGMSEEFIKEQLFKPFTQEKNDARTLYRGTGLGMSIVKALLDKMGGSIEVESQLGEGSTFTFRLPFKVNENAIETQKEEQSSGEQKLEGKQILLVEDNEINMEIAEFYLKELGIVVDKAWNGKEAIDKFEESAPGTYDLILMDIMMPVMGGREAARRIRTLERPDAETVRIYAMTAQVSSESVHKCLASGMNGHIAKPIDESKLREILTRCESVKKQKD